MSSTPIEVLVAEASREESASIRIPTQVPVPASVTTDQAVAAAGGGLRDRLQAAARAMQQGRTHDMPVPAWDGMLWVTIRPPHGVEEFARHPSDQAWIILCTASVWARDDDGTRVPLADGWTEGLADQLGLPWVDPPTLVDRVLGGEEMLVKALAMEMAEWSMGAASATEVALGE